LPEIVPIELALPSGSWFTLYQRGWDDADDDSLSFLGGDDQVYGFATPEDLCGYAIDHHDHHLGLSPLWRDVRRRSRAAFTPGPDDRYDLTSPSSEGQRILVELLEFLRVEVPQNWNQDPLEALFPRPGTVTEVPSWLVAPPATASPNVWRRAVEEVDGRIGSPPGEASEHSGFSTLATAAPLEEVAPGVESIWLGVADAGAYTLLYRDIETGWLFLGPPGTLAAAGSTASLVDFLSRGQDPVLAQPPWVAVRGRTDVDVEPYEDNVIDLDQLGLLLRAPLNRAAAAALLDVRPLVQELGNWLELDDVLRAFDEDQPLGRFFVRDLLDIVGGAPGAVGRLEERDVELLTESWTACMTSIAGRIRWLD
jgi:hypothetical protein